MDFAEAQIAGREEYLAQWDVLVLNPQNVADQGLDLGRLRAVNPAIKILAWIPFGQSSLDMDLSTSMPGIESGRYFVRDLSGQPLRWDWGGYFMNPYADDYAFPRHVASYVEEHYLAPGTYDGVMFDCLWSLAPRSFWSSPRPVDVNGDGRDTPDDDAAYVAGVELLLRSLREAAPDAIITGNPGDPWGGGYPYYAHVNGVMIENALGTEWRRDDGLWDGQWAGYQASLGSSAAAPGYTFVIADLRMRGVTQEQARTAGGLTVADLRRFRLALGMTLLGDGYFGFDRGDGNHGQLWWFPEYDVDLGEPWPENTAPSGTYASGRYGDAGTLSREFRNATVVVNPGMGSVRVVFVDVRTDASTGAAGTTFELPANDARIFVRSCAASGCDVPPPPEPWPFIDVGTPLTTVCSSSDTTSVPAFTADGQHLVYCTWVDVGEGLTAWLELIGVDGRQGGLLPPGSPVGKPAAAPDGTAIYVLGYTVDGSSAATSYVLRDAVSGRSFEMTPAPVPGLLVPAPSGGRLLLTSSGGVILFDPATGAVQGTPCAPPAAFSPAGDEIACQRAGAAPGSFIRFRPSDAGVQALRAGSTAGQPPASISWAPDRILAAFAPAGDAVDIVIADLQTGEAIARASPRDALDRLEAPELTRDGSMLAYAQRVLSETCVYPTCAQEHQVMVVELATGASTRIASGLGFGGLTLDGAGERIAYVYDGVLYVRPTRASVASATR